MRCFRSPMAVDTKPFVNWDIYPAFSALFRILWTLDQQVMACVASWELSMMPRQLWECFKGHTGWREQLRAEIVQNAVTWNIVQGEPLPKRDIVDTTFHASCVPGPRVLLETVLPTTWEKAKEQQLQLGRLVTYTVWVLIQECKSWIGLYGKCVIV